MLDTGSPQLKTICLTMVQSYNGFHKSDLWLSPQNYNNCAIPSHVTWIWVPGKWLAFTMAAESYGHTITICNLPSQHPTSKINGGSWIHLFVWLILQLCKIGSSHMMSHLITAPLNPNPSSSSGPKSRTTCTQRISKCSVLSNFCWGYVIVSLRHAAEWPLLSKVS